MYKRLKKLNDQLGFKFVTKFYQQPKIEGHYKNHWWQIHYVSKDTGENWGLPRTYIKLQFTKPKKFDLSKFQDYNEFNGHNIIEIRHIVRSYKNYLLMKRAWFTFEVKDIKTLMDFLIEAAKRSEIK